MSEAKPPLWEPSFELDDAARAVIKAEMLRLIEDADVPLKAFRELMSRAAEEAIAAIARDLTDPDWFVDEGSFLLILADYNPLTNVYLRFDAATFLHALKDALSGEFLDERCDEVDQMLSAFEEAVTEARRLLTETREGL